MKFLESPLEEFFRLLVSSVKFFKHESELVVDLRFREGADASDHAQNAVIARRLEWPQDDALLVGRKYDSGSFDWQGMFINGGLEIPQLDASFGGDGNVEGLGDFCDELSGNDSHRGTQTAYFDE